MEKPLFLLISGKRCVGKDYLANFLKMVNNDLEIMHLGYYPKLEISKIHNLYINRLLNDRKYKEIHRKDIIELANSKRHEDPTIWINMLYKDYLEKYKDKKIIVIPDHRFQEEFLFLKDKNLNVKRVRINRDDKTREKNGWNYDKEVDNNESEISLDHIKEWSYIFN